MEHTIAAVNYLHRGGSTRIDFNGTPIMAMGKGSAKVESERGVIKIGAEFKNMAPPSSFGPEYLTYVLWAISPDGRPVNLGELTLNGYGMGSDSKIDTTSDIQTFGMIVTAEPYYSVTQPSDVVVMENIVRPTTQGVIENINAKYELLPRGMYTNHGKAQGFAPIVVGRRIRSNCMKRRTPSSWPASPAPQKYATDSFQKAQDALQQSLKYQVQKPGQKPVITMAREACLRAEDARIIALRAERAEALENERQAGIARENAEKQKAEEARMHAEDEARPAGRRKWIACKPKQAKTEALTHGAKRQHDARLLAGEGRRGARQGRSRAGQSRSRPSSPGATGAGSRQAAVAQQQLLAASRSSKMAAADADRLRMKAEQDSGAAAPAVARSVQFHSANPRHRAGLDRQHVRRVVRHRPLHVEARRARKAGQGFGNYSRTPRPEDRGRRPHR